MRPTYNKGPVRRLDVAGELEGGVSLSLFVWGFFLDEEGGVRARAPVACKCTGLAQELDQVV